MTYNPPFLYRCEYNDGKYLGRQYVFGEAGAEAFYNRCIAELSPGSKIVIDYYDRRRKKWRPVVLFILKGGETDGS